MNEKKSIKKKLLLIIILLCILLLAFVGYLIYSRSRSTRSDSHVDLAKQYVDELDYEQAIAELEMAIKIDPKNESAYLELAEVYKDLGEYDSAIKVLKDGYEKTESKRLNRRMKEYKEEKKQNEAAGIQSVVPENDQPPIFPTPQAQETEEVEGGGDRPFYYDRPEDAGEFEGHYYYVYPEKTVATYEEALEYCRNLGGHLADLTSQEENDFVFEYMKSTGCKSAYFGIYLTQDGYVLSDGTTLAEYLNWHPGEPNRENPNEKYAMFYFKFSDGTWNDGDFGYRTNGGDSAFICEWDY